MRVVKHSISDVDNKIQQYMDVFANLRSQFNEQAVVHTEITVIRILDEVHDLGVCGITDHSDRHLINFN